LAFRNRRTSCVLNEMIKTGTLLSSNFPIETYRSAAPVSRHHHVDEGRKRTSTCRMSRTLLSLIRPCCRNCSMVAQSTLYVCRTSTSVNQKDTDRLTHGVATPSSQGFSVCRQVSIDYLGNNICSEFSFKALPIKSGICAVSFSSNQEPTVCVTERSDEMIGFSDSSYDCRREEKVRKMGLVSFILFHAS
jgi:hypothetical protein